MREYGWEKRYVSSEEGWNSRLDELQAAILRIKLKNLDVDNNRRHKLANIYQNELNELPLQLPRVRNDSNHVFHLFVIKTDQRDKLMGHLRENGMQSTIQYPVPVHQQDFYIKTLGDYSLPVTEKSAGSILSLPMYPELDEADQKQVVDVLHNYYKGQ